MAIHFDDTGLISGHVSELRAVRDALEKHLEGQPMQVCLRARYDDALKALDTALDAVTCELCADAVAVERQAGAFCQTCSDLFVVCVGCHEDVPLADAVVTPAGMESGFYHGPCYPDGAR